MKIKQIEWFDTKIDNVHESCYRSYQTLQFTIDMLKRWDSNKTILEILELLWYDS